MSMAATELYDYTHPRTPRRRLRMILTLLLVAALSTAAAVGIHVRAARHTLRQERAKVHQLVQPGQPIADAQARLVARGYKLAYNEPIYPTLDKDYQHQLVIIGQTQPSALDTLCYIMDWQNPLSPGSPYVVIDADTEGVILRVE